MCNTFLRHQILLDRYEIRYISTVPNIYVKIHVLPPVLFCLETSGAQRTLVHLMTLPMTIHKIGIKDLLCIENINDFNFYSWQVVLFWRIGIAESKFISFTKINIRPVWVKSHNGIADIGTSHAPSYDTMQKVENIEVFQREEKTFRYAFYYVVFNVPNDFIANFFRQFEISLPSRNIAVKMNKQKVYGKGDYPRKLFSVLCGEGWG